MAADYKLQVALLGDDRQLKATLERVVKDIQAIAAAAGKAVTPIEQMGNAAAKMRGVDALQKLQQDLRATEAALKQSRAELVFFTEGAKKAGAQSGMFAADISKAQRTFDRLGQQLGAQRTAFGQLSAVLRSAGVDTSNLASATDALAREQQDAAQAADAEKRAAEATAVAMEKAARIEQSRIKYYTELLNAQVQQIQKERELAAAAKATAEARSQGREQNRIKYYTDLLSQQVAAAQKARAEVERLTQAYQKSELANVRRGTVLTPVASGIGKGEVTAITGLTAAATPAVSAMQRLREALGQVGSSARGNSTAFNLMTGQVYGLVGAYVSLRGAWLLLQNTFQQGTNLQIINASLKFAIGSAEGARREFEFLRRETDRLGIGFDSAATQFAQLAAATRGTSLEGQKTRDIFLGIAEGARAAGLANEEVEGTLRAVTQIASKGVVQYEELRGQLGDRLPAALRLAAQAMGVTQGELTSMVQAGKVTAEEFLPKFAEAIRRDAAGALEEATQSGVASLSRLDNAIKRLQRAFAESGFMREVTAAFNDMTAALNNAEGKARTLGAEFGRMTRQIIDGVRQAIQVTVEWWEAIKTLVAGLLGFKATMIVVGIVASIVEALTKLGAALAWVGRNIGLTPAFGAIGAALTVAIPLIYKAVDAWLAYRNAVNEANDRKKEWIEAQQKILAANRSEVRSPGSDAAQEMRSQELRQLQQSLAETEEYWRAKALLESEGNQGVTKATKERLDLARTELREISTILARRAQIEKENNDIILAEKKRANKQLEADLANAYNAYKFYADKIKALQTEAKAFGDKLLEIREKVNAPQADLTKGTVLEPVNLIQKAKVAIDEGDFRKARKLSDMAATSIDNIAESGKATKTYLNSLLDQIAEVYSKAADGEEKVLEQNRKSAEDLIGQIMGQMAALKNVEIGFDMETTIGNAREAARMIQEVLDTVVVAPQTYSPAEMGDAVKRVEPVEGIKGYASGGHIRGPGTATSDSILARLSAGEYVVRAKAVKQYGLNVLDRLNNLRLPEFALGGLVPPMVPAMATAGPVGTPVNLYLPSGESFPMRAEASVAKQLTRILGAEVLKRGRR